jgi:hypothetical protein
MSELLYDCPSCSGKTSVSESLVGQNLVCPHCEQQFYATPPSAALEEAIPFFKFSRRKRLKQELERLTADGEYSEADHKTLIYKACNLGLHEDEIDNLRMAAFRKEVEAVQAQIYQTAQMSDEDVEHLRQISQKYNITIAEEPLFKVCRDIYIMEEKNEFPLVPLRCPDVMVDGGEYIYFGIETEWSQLRSRSKGYSGISMSIPTGIKGVRFRLGQLTPIRSEELAALARGTLYVTSKRLIFNGDRRNTTVTYRRILGTSVFSDAIEIEKITGRSDYFSMNAIYARYISAITRILKRKPQF